jgi:hypothetical protein
MQREAKLLCVRQLLVAEHQNGVFGHAGMDGRNLVRRQRRRQSTPVTSPAKVGASCLIDMSKLLSTRCGSEKLAAPMAGRYQPIPAATTALPSGRRRS